MATAVVVTSGSASVLGIPRPSAPRGAAGDTHLQGHGRVTAAGPQQSRAGPFPPLTRCPGAPRAPRSTPCGTAPVPGTASGPIPGHPYGAGTMLRALLTAGGECGLRDLLQSCW